LSIHSLPRLDHQGDKLARTIKTSITDHKQVLISLLHCNKHRPHLPRSNLTLLALL